MSKKNKHKSKHGKKKNKKIEKETRRLIESISDLLKRQSDGTYRFKGAKKKTVKAMRRNCPHWIIRGGEERPAVSESKEHPGEWTCKICGKRFPIAPFTELQYDQICDTFLGVVNQLFFLSVKMGGDSSDTKVFLKLKELVPKLKKIARNEAKALNKREEFEKSRRDEGNSFDAYTSFSYR